MRKIIYILLFFSFGFVAFNFFSVEKNKIKEITENSEDTKIKFVKKNKIKEITEGSEDAKIEIYAFQSLTCPHCATFHNKVYPLLKKDFVDNGIIKIYFKHFPLNLAALNAAKILQCAEDEKKISFLNYLYETQEEWTMGETIEDINQNLKISAKKFGLTSNDFDKCLILEEVEDFILNSRIEAVKNFEIESTPTIVIDGRKFEGTLEYKNIKETIEKLI